MIRPTIEPVDEKIQDIEDDLNEVMIEMRTSADSQIQDIEDDLRGTEKTTPTQRSNRQHS